MCQKLIINQDGFKLNYRDIESKVLSQVVALASAAKDGALSSMDGLDAFKRYIEKMEQAAKDAYQIMAGRKDLGDKDDARMKLAAFTGHFLDPAEISSGSKQKFDIWGDVTQEGAEAFYNISATNLVTTGARILKVLDKLSSSVLKERVRWMDSFNEKVLSQELVLRRFVRPWKKCSVAMGGSIERCIACSCNELKDTHLKSNYLIGGQSKSQTTDMDILAKRDFAFNFYFIEKEEDKLASLHANRYGSMVGNANLNVWDRLYKSGMIQTLDLITPEMHGLMQHQTLGHKGPSEYFPEVRERVYLQPDLEKGKAVKKATPVDLKKGVVVDIRRAESEVRKKKIEDIKAHGFRTDAMDVRDTMPLELIFVGPHIRPGLLLRAWDSFLRMSFVDLQNWLGGAAKLDIGDLFRIQALIPGFIHFKDHEWKLLTDSSKSPAPLNENAHKSDPYRYPPEKPQEEKK